MIVASDDVQGAPMDSLVFGRVEPSALASTQAELSKQFRDVSFLDSQTLADRLMSLLKKLSLALALLSFVAFLGAAFVIVGIQLSRRLELGQDFALLRVLGLNSSEVRLVVLSESFLVGALSMVSSVLMSAGLAFGVLKFFLEVEVNLSSLLLVAVAGVVLTFSFAGASWLVVRDLRRSTVQSLMQSWGQ
jgi:putative ABC transport system permease protein